MYTSILIVKKAQGKIEMDAVQMRIVYVFTDLILPLMVGYFLHQKHLISGELCNKLILFNIVVIGTILSILSFWVLPLSLELIWLPVFGVLLCFIPGLIGHLLFEKNYKDFLERGAYLASASLSNIGTLGGLCAFILYGEIGFAYTQMVGISQNFVLLVVCFPIAQYYRQCHENSKSNKKVGVNLREILFSWKQLPVLGMVLGMFLYLYDVPRPSDLAAVFSALVHVGAWFALLPVGYLIDFSRAKQYYARMNDLMLVKFILAPILTYFLVAVLFENPVLRGTMMILSAVPTAINAVITARLFKLNVDLTIASFILTTAVFLLILFPAMFFYITSGGML